ncbi:radical SAM protein [Enterococcus cecorum]|uniref:radical SAM protein n=3 Tax=Enterococcus cecorum TaxID=44008 RepID=UPI001FAB5C7D|nr:radical SAM protein [Enterococcus cecorum]MCJ0538736.1 radical SAM protein [Enterococcus cecorum]MCJ0551856.1 radical SAM protein [Enterococcus cecorum]MCJ0570404.1 radical SAM protein [Enterococcus cecorum]
MKYLFIRIHEACNAGCWFCGFAKSKDTFRLSEEEYADILEVCLKEGVSYIRFTGGEPLLEPRLPHFIKMASNLGIKTSVITNGSLLVRRAKELSESGLSQIIVSIDDIGERHNNNRKIKNLFEKGIEGLKLCKSLGIRTRVNTVCGPHNFRNMVKLQEIFTKIGVDYWELSALKLDMKIEYDATEQEISEIIKKIYFDKDKLVPYGKMWCGNSKIEQEKYFNQSLPPRVNTDCSMTSRIRYYDAKNRNMYVCSLLPHRLLKPDHYYHFDDGEKFVYSNKEIDKIADFYRNYGKEICTGCSSTAAYYGEKSTEYVENKIWEY